MRFLLDMGISPLTGRFLRHLGHDTVHLSELGLERLEDPGILEKAAAEGSVVLTHDLDLGDLLAASGRRVPTVITFRLRNMRPENVNRYLERILERHTDSIGKGAILSVREGLIRVHALPLEKD